ncbi:MAG: hypothetical protein H7Y31_10935 [Chitinophagaceae bacterium]|nr:hypothetical protein [Chitinophagaceae bacterium]
MKRHLNAVLGKLVATMFVCASTIYPVFSQNVGIGTVSPAEKLHVAGNIKADTVKPSAIKFAANAGNGKILTSDATGNASWQTSTSTGGNVGYGVWGDCATNGNISDYQPVADATGAVSDLFGMSVSIDNNFAIVGAPLAKVGENFFEAGSASIYQYNGNSWVFMQKITDPAGQNGDHFGISVSISGNYAIIGAYQDNVGAINADHGSACVFQYNGSSWVFMQKIVDPGGAANDQFGRSVAISGNHCVIGAHLDDFGAMIDKGSASFFRYNGTNWILTQKSADPAGGGGDKFGTSVSMSGNNVVIGAFEDGIGSAAYQGSVTVYHYNGTTGWDLVQTITDANGAGGDNFGVSVSIAGNYFVVGSYNDDVGANTNQGSAFIYRFDGATWVLMQQLTDPIGVAGDLFGYSVSISGNYVLIGAVNHDTGVITDPGAAILYQRLGIGWQKMQLISDPAGNVNNFFGLSAGISELSKQFIIGATGFNNGTGKAVFGKIN